MKQTALEFLEGQLIHIRLDVDKNVLKFIDTSIEKAKEMEKKDICHFGAKCCFMTNQKKSWTIEELYNETFKKK